MIPTTAPKIEGSGYVLDMSEVIDEYHNSFDDLNVERFMTARITISELINTPTAPYEMNPILDYILSERRNAIEMEHYDISHLEMMYDAYGEYVCDYVDRLIKTPHERIQLSSWLDRTTAIFSVKPSYRD